MPDTHAHAPTNGHANGTNGTHGTNGTNGTKGGRPPAPGARTTESAQGDRESTAAPARVPAAEPGSPAWRVPRTELPDWTLLTNHAHVLLCIRNDPTIRVRDVAYLVGITERAAHKIVADLGAAGYITRTKVGRRNQYEIHADVPLRHPLERHHTIGELLDVLAGEATGNDDTDD